MPSARPGDIGCTMGMARGEHLHQLDANVTGWMGFNRMFLPCRYLFASVLLTSSPTGCGSADRVADSDELPDICDGSDDIRLYVADWAAGNANPAVDYVMYAEGVRFLKIDGHCHYYAFDGEGGPYRWWEPVHEGDFSDTQLDEIVERLEVERWGTFDESDLIWPNYHEAWNRFNVGDHEFECPSGCGGAVARMLWEARKLTEELVIVSQPVVPDRVEAVVVEAHETYPFAVEWGSSLNLGTFVASPSELATQEEQLGILLDTSEEPWFLDVTAEYRADTQGRAPSAIGLVDEEDRVSHLLYIRPVVP